MSCFSPNSARPATTSSQPHRPKSCSRSPNRSPVAQPSSISPASPRRPAWRSSSACSNAAKTTPPHRVAFTTARLRLLPKASSSVTARSTAFENSCILAGNSLETFDLLGWKCGLLICYDNNLPENNRVLALKAPKSSSPHISPGHSIFPRLAWVALGWNSGKTA